MSSVPFEGIPSAGEETPMREYAAEAIKVIDDCLEKFPEENAQILQAAEVWVVRLRDAIIQRCRHAHSVAANEALRSDLVAANTCLSLVLGSEFPQGSAKRKSLEMARALLVKIQERD